MDLYGLVGNDCWGKIVWDLLEKYGIGSGGVLVQDENWQTHVYHKIYAGREESPCYDMGNKNLPADERAGTLLSLFESRLDEYDCVIINEQVPSEALIFEKALSMARNVSGGGIRDCDIHVVDLHESNWDWSKGEPPMDNPAYYLRFMKTFNRMGMRADYTRADNRDFFTALYRALRRMDQGNPNLRRT
ncbi:hypothetical protein FACS1894109_21040 [Spirochaetia bacterium]|nr:hypothetical protein FACS1894109_21040 [Spirochaetia bacterium]